jgi:hypothetical protein
MCSTYIYLYQLVECVDIFFRRRLKNMPASYGSLGFDLTPLEAGSPAAGG